MDTNTVTQLEDAIDKLINAYDANLIFIEMMIAMRNILHKSVMNDKEKCSSILLVLDKYQALWEKLEIKANYTL